jgi:hypothetical protein
LARGGACGPFAFLFFSFLLAFLFPAWQSEQIGRQKAPEKTHKNMTHTHEMTHTEAREALRAEFAALGLIAEVTRKNKTPEKDSEGWLHWPWLVSIRYLCPGPSDSIRLPYRHGIALTDAPEPAEVLANYCRDWLDAQQPFEDWAGNYGYDSDSRKAERIWKQCRDCLPAGVLSRETCEKLANLVSML